MARQKKQDQPVATTAGVPATTAAVAEQPVAAATEQAAPVTPTTPTNTEQVATAQQEVAEIIAANPAPLPVVIDQDKDSIFLTEDQVVTDHFENPRGETEELAVTQMVRNLQDNGQIQNISVGAMITDGVYSGKFPVCAGWTRTEAYRRMVYSPLISRFNKDNELTSTMTGFLLVTNPKHREIVSKVYAEDLAKNRQKFKLRVKVHQDVKTAADAFKISVYENVIRNDMSLFRQVQAADDAIVKYGLKPKEAAAMLDATAGEISQNQKVNKLLPALREKLVTPDPGEQMSESDLVKLAEDVKTLTNELERRMKLNPRSPLTAKFSNLREFAYRVITKEGEEPRLTRPQIMQFLCDLVGADPTTHKLLNKGEAPHKNYTLFVKEMAAAEELNKKQKELAAQPATPAAADGTTPAPAVAADGTAIPAGTTPAQEQAGTGTVEELAKAQASGAAEAAALNVGATVAPAPAGTPAPAQSSVATALSMSAEELEHVDTDSPLPDDGPEDTTPAGQKKAKTGAAPVQQFNIKTPDRIHKIGLEQAALALQDQDEEQVLNSFWTAAVAGSAATAFEVLGMDEKYKRWNDAILKYVESMEVYLGELEQFAKTAGAKAGLKPPQGLVRPRFTVEGETVDDAFAEGTDGLDDDAELPDETGEPSDDDLAEIEAMDIGMGDDEEDLESLQALVGKEGEVTDEV